MVHVGPEWSYGIVYDDTRHINMAKKGGSWLGFYRCERQFSKGMDCDILGPVDCVIF
jgi:hypothetical protein